MALFVVEITTTVEVPIAADSYDDAKHYLLSSRNWMSDISFKSEKSQEVAIRKITQIKTPSDSLLFPRCDLHGDRICWNATGAITSAEGFYRKVPFKIKWKEWDDEVNKLVAKFDEEMSETGNEEKTV